MSNKPQIQSSDSSNVARQHLGKVVGFLGLKGTLKILPATNNPSLFLEINEVTFQLASGQEETVVVEKVRLNKRMLELQTTNYETRTSVEHLLHANVLVESSQIADLAENEWWLKDLIGMKVFTTDGDLIGTVCDALGKEGEFLEIRKADDLKGDTVLVPFVRQLVPVVDLKAGKIEVVNLPGLFD